MGTAKFEEGTAKFVEGEGVSIGIDFTFDYGKRNAKKHTYWDETGYDMNEWSKEKSEPLHIKSDVCLSLYRNGSVWVFKDYLYLLEGVEYESEDVKKTYIKHFALKKEKQFSKMVKEVERFERFERINPVYREQIPEEVRMYVWRRDNGRCVKCNKEKSNKI